MLRRLTVLTWAMWLTGASVAAYTPPPSPRVKYNFNSGWKLFVGDPAGAQAPEFDGANAETARRSFDDDETTQWTSDGRLDHGWIKYDWRSLRASQR